MSTTDINRCPKCGFSTVLTPMAEGPSFCTNLGCSWSGPERGGSQEGLLKRQLLPEPETDQDEKSYNDFITRLMETANISDLERDVLQDCIMELHKSFHLQLKRWRESYKVFQDKHSERIKPYVDNKPDLPRGLL